MERHIFTGLHSQEVQEKLARVGFNTIGSTRGSSFFQTLLAQYLNVITGVLVFAAAFSFFIHEFVDAGFILLVILVNGLFGFLQEYRAEKALEKLQTMMVAVISVVRDGIEQEIEVKQLVPGDVVVLQEGDRVPADGKLLDHIPLEIDESIFTGESLPVEKTKGDGLYSGTFVIRGRGYMVVEKTGFLTKLGTIALEMKEVTRPTTPLAQNLDQLGKRIMLIAFILVLFIFPIGYFQSRNIEHLMITVVSLAVAVIPEGLPLVVTAALGIGAYRMAGRGAIVRKMASIETLGSTSVVLSDKTGTLTQNDMRVKAAWLPQKKDQDLLMRGAVLANTARVVLSENKKTYEALGDKTDGAFLLYVQEQVEDLEEYRSQGTVISEEPFDPDTKLIRVVWEHEKKRREFVRGAVESVLPLLPEKEREVVEKKNIEFATSGMRVIAFASKDTKEKKFVFTGLMGVYDPPRLEAKETLAQARKAGIRVVVVTGDSPETALAIGEEIGLVEKDDLVLTSDDIAKQSDDELSQALPRVRIFARMRPHDKLRLVQLYKKAGFVVAVTGDGVNDALALAEAHIGVAMGETGTDVAKEAADLVITDDNLSTIIRAVEEGRRIFDNIVTVVVYLFSSNASEFLIIFAGILLGLPIPLLPTQILYINFISDGLPALALATDTQKQNLLLRKPRDVSEQLLNKKRMKRILLIFIPFSLLLISLYFVSLQFFPVSFAQLILFNALVIGEMAMVFVVRGSLFPINRFLLISVAAALLLQLLIMFNPFLRSIFS